MSPPSGDGPISQLSKDTAFPFLDALFFKDHMDKKMDGLLCSLFFASGTSLWPILATAWVSRVVQAWSESLLQAILSGSLRNDLSWEVISPVPSKEQFKGYYSNLFVVPKRRFGPAGTGLKGTGFSALEGLRWNLYTPSYHQSPSQSHASLDIKDVYLHEPLFPSNQRYV